MKLLKQIPADPGPLKQILIENAYVLFSQIGDTFLTASVVNSDSDSYVSGQRAAQIARLYQFFVPYNGQLVFCKTRTGTGHVTFPGSHSRCIVCLFSPVNFHLNVGPCLPLLYRPHASNPITPVLGAHKHIGVLAVSTPAVEMHTDSVSFARNSNNITEVSLRQIFSSVIGEHEDCDNAIAVITTFIKTITTLVQLIPNLTSVQHSSELMKKYINSCQVAIQTESLAILQSKYSTELSNIPEEFSLSNQGSPVRSVSPDLKIPQLRAKTAPRRSLAQPGTRKSLTMVRRKSCEPDLSASTACFRVTPRSTDRESSGIPLHPKSNQTAHLRRSKTLDVSKSVDLGVDKRSLNSVSYLPLSARKAFQDKSKKQNSLRQSPGSNVIMRRNSDVHPFNDASIDVARSVDWGSFTSSCSSSGNLPNDEPDFDIENHSQAQMPQKQTRVKELSKPRLSLSRLQLTDSERRRVLQPEYAAVSKENERRNSEFLQNVEELVAKSSPYDEVFATRTKILNE